MENFGEEMKDWNISAQSLDLLRLYLEHRIPKMLDVHWLGHFPPSNMEPFFRAFPQNSHFNIVLGSL